jgi:hypothetical protein
MWLPDDLSSDKYIKIIENENAPCGLEAINCHVTTMPQASDIEPGGMYVLQQLPPSNIQLKPMGFVAGSRSYFDDFHRRIKLEFRSQPDVIRQWDSWSERVPLSDDCIEFVSSSRSTWHVPLRTSLFPAPDCDTSTSVSSRQVKRRTDGLEELRQFYSTDSVKWSHRGKKIKQPDSAWVDDKVVTLIISYHQCYIHVIVIISFHSICVLLHYYTFLFLFYCVVT